MNHELGRSLALSLARRPNPATARLFAEWVQGYLLSAGWVKTLLKYPEGTAERIWQSVRFTYRTVEVVVRFEHERQRGVRVLMCLKRGPHSFVEARYRRTLWSAEGLAWNEYLVADCLAELLKGLPEPGRKVRAARTPDDTEG